MLLTISPFCAFSCDNQLVLLELIQEEKHFTHYRNHAEVVTVDYLVDKLARLEFGRSEPVGRVSSEKVAYFLVRPVLCILQFHRVTQ